MDIRYKNSKIESLCNNRQKGKTQLNVAVSKELQKALTAIHNAETLLDIHKTPRYNLHPLKGKRRGELSIYLGKTGFRLIIIPEKENGEIYNEADLMSLYSIISIVRIMEVSNHYE